MNTKQNTARGDMGLTSDQDRMAASSMTKHSSGLLLFMGTVAASVIIAASAGAAGANITCLITKAPSAILTTELPEPKNVLEGLPDAGDDATSALNERCTVAPKRGLAVAVECPPHPNSLGLF